MQRAADNPQARQAHPRQAAHPPAAHPPKCRDHQEHDMANFKTQTGQGYPSTQYDKLTENDPMIVKVPMDNVDFGSRKSKFIFM